MVEEKDSEIKAKLPPGIWMDEPDYQHWVDEETGLDCLIVRQPDSGHLCGYVGIPKNHPLFGIKYNDCSLSEARVPNAEEVAQHILDNTNFAVDHLKYTPERAVEYGTWALDFWKDKRKCSDEWCKHTPEYIFQVHGGLTYSNECHDRICHKTDNGDHVWWFGFDCAHFGDMCPMRYYRNDGIYRDIHYVMNECRLLAEQLKDYKTNDSGGTI